jgi:hypothetical protein
MDTRLQVEPGLFGVIKVRWRTWPSPNWLRWVLAAVFFLLIAAPLVLWLRRSVQDPPRGYVIACIVFLIALIAIVGFRLILEGTVSKPPPGARPRWDGWLVDPWWTPIHFLTGFTLGIWLVPFVLAAILTVAWELFEISVPGFGDEEITGNRLFDILFGWVGWLIAAVIIISNVEGVSLPLV